MIIIYQKAFFYEQLKLGKISFFEVPLRLRRPSNSPHRASCKIFESLIIDLNQLVLAH